MSWTESILCYFLMNLCNNLKAVTNQLEFSHANCRAWNKPVDAEKKNLTDPVELAFRFCRSNLFNNQKLNYLYENAKNVNSRSSQMINLNIRCKNIRIKYITFLVNEIPPAFIFFDLFFTFY